MKLLITILLTIFILNINAEEQSYTLNQLFGQEDIVDLSGSLGIYYRDLSNREENQAREEFGNAQLWLHAVTKEWNGLSFGISGLYNYEVADEEFGYDNSIADKNAILAEVFASYKYSKTLLTIGRQVKGPDDGGWIMLDDFYEGVFIESDEIENFNIRLTWVNRSAVFDPDEITRYEEFNGENDTDGVYGAEVIWSGLENLQLSGVYYRANGAYKIAGAILEHQSEFDKFSNDFLVEYYTTWENGNHGLGAGNAGETDHGSISHIYNNMNFESFSLGFGYIAADKNIGSGSLINNPWDPFEEDDFHTQLSNARTWYVTGECSLCETVSLGLVYGQTNADTGNNEDARYDQFNAIINWDCHEQVSLEAGYVHVKTTDSVEEGFDKAYINAILSF